jgi:hypothetical protein
MTQDIDERSRKIVNASGFPLQIRLKHLVQNNRQKQSWEVITEEHPWKNNLSGASGFLDLILEEINKTQVLLIECKRVKDSQWVFLIPSENPGQYRLFRPWTTYLPGWFNWKDWEVSPPSFESTFCTVPGQDSKAKPMLERIASDIVEATEAYAEEERRLEMPRSKGLNTYFPVIVTTADLRICKFDPGEVNLKSGEIEKGNCTYADVPFIRFKKALTARNEEVSAKDINAVFREKERTVFVINSLHFLKFLEEWDLGEEVRHSGRPRLL